MKQQLTGADGYDTIFLGFPIWWGKAPKIVFTFLDSLDLTGKKVAVFCTSGGTKQKQADADVKAHVPAGVIAGDCALLNDATDEAGIRAWVESILG